MSDFSGFSLPASNYYRVPHTFVDLLGSLTNLSQVQVLNYILRHTWGFSEYDSPKCLDFDDFLHGRKCRKSARFPNGRMDAGCGVGDKATLSRTLSFLCASGYILIYLDADHNRANRWYRLRMDFDKDKPDRIIKTENPELWAAEFNEIFVDGESTEVLSSVDGESTKPSTLLTENQQSPPVKKETIKKETIEEIPFPSEIPFPEVAEPIPEPTKPARKVSTHQKMLCALARIFKADVNLVAARYARFAKSLLNLGYTPAQIELWYSPLDQVDQIRSYYEADEIAQVTNPGWFYQQHWAGLKGQIPNQAFVRDSVKQAQQNVITQQNGNLVEDMVAYLLQE